MCVISQNATVIGKTADGHLQGVAERARPELQDLGDDVPTQSSHRSSWGHPTTLRRV